MHSWGTLLLASYFLIIGTVTAYRGADNRLLSAYDELPTNRHSDRSIEYHYPDEYKNNQISRGYHGYSKPIETHRYDGGTSNPGPWYRHPEASFTSHVNHIRAGGKEHRKPAVISSTGLHRTTQWGTARIPYRGASVNVSPSPGRQKTYRGIVTTTILGSDGVRQPATTSVHDDIGRAIVQDEPSPVEQLPCVKCPSDKTVVAGRGATFVLMAKPTLKPCHYKSWSPEVRMELLSGPKAGSTLQEGTHTIVSMIVYRQHVLQTCQFRYTVIVRKCPMLQLHDNLWANCTADNVWGSECRFSCAPGYQPLGPTTVECGDQLRWTQPLPQCIAVAGCSLPMSPEHGRISCTTSENDIGDLIPEGTVCQYVCKPGYVMPDDQSGLATISCATGEWNSTVDPICQESRDYSSEVNTVTSKRHRHRKHRLGRSRSLDPCRPNPCERGESCSAGPHPALALCSCPSRDGQPCHNIVLVERLIAGNNARERRKNKATMLIGNVYGKTGSDSTA